MILLISFLFQALAASSPVVTQGQYMIQAAGCLNCHTSNRAEPLGGGIKLKTPFGTFFAPNISSDKIHGIGSWSDQDFLMAVKHGVSPQGRYYYPAFPFSAYTKLTDEDVLAIKAYILTLAPQKTPSLPHQLKFPFNQRKLMFFWRKLNFKQKFLTANEKRTFKYHGDFRPKLDRNLTWNRGAYLVEGAFHCTECHTPRNQLGGLKTSQWMAGAAYGQDEYAGNITPDLTTGLGSWTKEDWELFLTRGELPDGGEVSGEMYRIIKNGTAKLTASDRASVIEYLQSFKSVYRSPTKP